MTATAWWRTPRAELPASLQSTAEGLSKHEARARLERHGPNEFRATAERPPWLQFLRRFGNPLVLILIVASGLSALTGDTAGMAIIVALVLCSVTLDFVQEHRAGRAAERLARSVQLRAQVLRDGVPTAVPVTHVVPGDVVLLASGTLVSADGCLLDAQHLYVDQSALTGESFPVEKRAVDAPGPAATPEAAPHVVLMGASVISGSGRMIVCRTGRATALGHVAHSLTAAPPPTAFELAFRRFGLMIMRLTVLMVLFVVMVNAVTHKPLPESFLFALALAVGLTPELLPMVVSVTLARGAVRMAARHVVVKRLGAIQNLGAMDVLCTDKTGTLTEAVVALARHCDLAGRESERVLRLAYVNSRFETGLKNPLDRAILAHAPEDVAGWRKIDEAPFDFERRRVSVLVDGPQGRMLIVKGAPEAVLALSTHYAVGEAAASAPLDEKTRAVALDNLGALSRDGYRVLGIAYKQTASEHRGATVDDETGLVFAGFAAFLDPPKASAGAAVRALAGSGVAIRILTGDNEAVTRHLCGALGIAVTGVLTGEEIARQSDAALRARVAHANLCCRLSPAQKTRVIAALRARGHVVGFVGDGINDAPALHAADVGVSVDSAVDVAKAAADLILRRRDLGVLHEAVVEGRRTHVNIRKYMMMGTSSNFGNMFSMAGAAVVLPFLPMLPVQILLNNVLYDVSEIAVPLDRVDAEEIARPNPFDLAFIRNFMWLLGPVSSLFDFLTFWVLLVVFSADAALFRTGWFVESLATQVLVIFVIRTRRSPLRSAPHPALVATSLAVVGAALALPYAGFGAALGFAPLPASFYPVLVALVVAYLALAEGGKRLFYARLRRRGHAAAT